MSVTQTCTICLQDFPENTIFTVKNKLSFEGEYALNTEQMSAIKIKCNHVFHEQCLALWIIAHKTKNFPPSCPSCRAVVIKKPAQVTENHEINDSDSFDDFSLLMTVIPTIPVLIAFELIRFFTSTTQNSG